MLAKPPLCLALVGFWFAQSAVLCSEMKNIWLTHMLCLDWLHKCMILCNPDLLSYFFPFWSISYFAFNHIGQTVGRLPGAVSQMVSLALDPSAQVSLPPPHCFARACCVFFPLYPCSWTEIACAKRPAVEDGEALSETQWVGSGNVFSSQTPWTFPVWLQASQQAARSW